MTTSVEAQRGRVAIVTGAARRIGATITRALHARGLDVVIHYRGSADEAEALRDELLDRRRGSAALVQADLAEHAAPKRIRDAALEAFGRIDVLVNNASAFYPTPVGSATPAQWDELMASNLRAPFFLAQACAAELSAREGAIVNMVDIHGLVPLPNHPVYSQAKAGLIAQTRALARELAPEVRVNGVAPGAILWPESEQSPEAGAEILERVPLQRQGRPEDIAGAVAFLALDAPYITGQILAVDGGRLLNM
ncbi:pteridine reductase [Wenzhouxiangella sp. EGI_FJ10409]|uniref:pteridine reductase n=1 Tax=Wenzhouxiangella sp. EGI_FJ10409 TaxID=3243767 RepID=UPI0035D7F32A